MIKIAGLKFKDRLDTEVFEKLLSIVGPIHSERILKYKLWQDQHRSLFGKLLVYKFLMEEAGITEFPDLHYDEYNRPYQKISDDIDFNITHSGEYVFCAIADKGRIGIDVEKCKDISMDIAIRFFSEYENSYLAGLPASEKNASMIKLWTLKEAYMKAKGSTFLIPLDKFYFDINDMNNIKFFHKTGEDVGKWKFSYHTLENDHHFSVCHDMNDRIGSMKIFSIDEFISAFLI